MRTLITGAGGFVGSYLSQLMSPALTGPMKEFDIKDATQVKSIVEKSRPEAVVHLAAQSFIPEAVKRPRETFEVNFIGTLNLLEALESEGFTGSFLFVGSGDVYGLVNEADLPVREITSPRPRNPYAVSKVAAEALCYQWSQTAKFKIVLTRSFNHIGPGQSEKFAISDFAKQIAKGRKASCLKLHVGDIDVTRDFLDVRDVVQAYVALIESGQNGEIYNVCSGVEHSIRSLIEKMSIIAGVDVQISYDSTRSRRADQSRMVGDPSKINDHTGWSPKISIEKTLSDIVKYWEAKLND